MSEFSSKPYWLIHHRILIEWTVEPISIRRQYVRRVKAYKEIPIRLKWMKPVKRPDLLPKEVVKKQGSWKSLRGNWRKIVARHKKEYPGCPFDYKKKTLIFK